MVQEYELTRASKRLPAVLGNESALLPLRGRNSSLIEVGTTANLKELIGSVLPITKRRRLILLMKNCLILPGTIFR